MLKACAVAAIVTGVLGLSVSGCAEANGPVDELTIVGSDYQFEAPDSIGEGLVRVSLDDQGPSPHHVVVLQVPPERSAREALQSIRSTGAVPEWLESVGGPESTELPETRPSFVSYFEAGEYVLACVLVDDRGEPHYRQGMVRALTVYPRTRPPVAALRAPTDTIAFHDFAYTMSGTLQAGRQRIWVENRGEKRHHAELLKLAPSVTFEGLVEALSSRDPSFPVQTVGGVTGLSPGNTGILEIALDAGRYALVCFFFDEELGMPHFSLSMIRLFEVQPRG